jgi:hypothetical protein
MCVREREKERVCACVCVCPIRGGTRDVVLVDILVEDAGLDHFLHCPLSAVGVGHVRAQANQRTNTCLPSTGSPIVIIFHLPSLEWNTLHITCLGE